VRELKERDSNRAERAAAILWTHASLHSGVRYLSKAMSGRPSMPFFPLDWLSVAEYDELSELIRRGGDPTRIHLIVEAGALPPLLELLDSVEGRGAELAAGAIMMICFCKPLRPEVLAAGAVPFLTRALAWVDSPSSALACFALDWLTALPESIPHMVSAQTVPAVVKLFVSSSPGSLGHGNALHMLASLVGHSDIHLLIVEAGAILSLFRQWVLATCDTASYILSTLHDNPRVLTYFLAAEPDILLFTLEFHRRWAVSGLEKWFPAVARTIQLAERSGTLDELLFKARIAQMQARRVELRLRMLCWRRCFAMQLE
jgi:hypothetical protein